MAAKAERTVGRGERAIATIFRNAVLKYVGAEGETPTSWFGRVAQGAEGKLMSTAGEAALLTLEDPEVQENAAVYIKDVMGEFVTGAKLQLLESASSVHELAQGEDRSPYRMMRDLLGNNKDDRWYIKIVKAGGAYVFSRSLPLVNIVSAHVAARMANKNNPEMIEQYKHEFDKTSKSLLSIFSKKGIGEGFQSIYDKLLDRLSAQAAAA